MPARKKTHVYRITNEGGSPFEVETKAGRLIWAIDHLMKAGKQGCTPIDTPGPRWAGYVHKLRNKGIKIETIEEAHGGPYAGFHARYILRSNVELLRDSSFNAEGAA